MRTIKIPPIDWSRVRGAHSVSIPVIVDWPEVQLTEEQIVANAISLANGLNDPYPNNAIIDVVIERPRGGFCGSVHCEAGCMQEAETGHCCQYVPPSQRR